MATAAPISPPQSVPQAPEHIGLRLSADEYFDLPDDGFRYELVDGVAVMTPSPSPRHQKVAFNLARQLAEFLDDNPLGELLFDTDILLEEGVQKPLIYRPYIAFFAKSKQIDLSGPVRTVPDLVVEVISPASRRFDHETKKADYQRCGVSEYWLIDPHLKSMTFYRLEDGQYVESKPEQDKLASRVLGTFQLDLIRIAKSFEA